MEAVDVPWGHPHHSPHSGESPPLIAAETTLGATALAAQPAAKGDIEVVRLLRGDGAAA
jgi:hypothetical protein